jgi:hypothetical protein
MALANHLFGELHTMLAAETIVLSFRDSGWGVHRSATNEYRMESNLGELTLVARAPFLLHGPIANVADNVDVIRKVLDPRVGYSYECFGHDATLWRLTTWCVSLPQDLLARLDLTPVEPRPDDKLGLALTTLSLVPLNGLRHGPENGTSGWYVWGGELLSEDPEFFQPLHHSHVPEHCPNASRFLHLPPGWRFLWSDHQCDIWRDSSLV